MDKSEARVARDGIILIEAQVIAMELSRKKEKPLVKLKQSIPAISVHKTLITWEISKVSAAFINRLLLTLTLALLLPNS